MRQKHDAGLIILGEGHLRGPLQQLIDALGLTRDVHMPGFQPNPLAWVAKCDVYVLSSKSEGLANVLLEAMIAGVPVVSTRCPSGPEEILQDGKYGTLVPLDDVGMMAAAMSGVLEKTHGATATQAEIQAYLDRTFSYPLMIAGYLSVAHTVEAEA